MLTGDGGTKVIPSQEDRRVAVISSMVSVLGVAPFYELITELALFSSSKLGNGDNNLGVFRPGT